MAIKKKNKKKSTTPPPQQQMSPQKYITSGRARLLPIHECFINSDWKTAGICSIIVTRIHGTGKFTCGIYLVDIFCLGLKNTSLIFNKDTFDYQTLFNSIADSHDGAMMPIDYVLAHNIIYGAIGYAEDLGFKPEKDWALTQFILEEDTEDIELIEVEFGQDGKPLYIAGPYDNVIAIQNKLNKNVGAGNYHFVSLLMEGMFSDDDDDDDDFEDDEYDDDDAEDIDYEEVKS